VRDAIDVLGKLGGQTIPFLPVSSLHGVWIDPAWQHCAHPAPAVSDMLGVLASLSARDFGAAGERASKMLASRDPDLSNASLDYLLRIAMLSALATGHPENVRSIEDGPGAAVPPLQTTIWQHVYMLAVAHERRAKASGAAQASK